MKKNTITLVLALLCLNFWARGQSAATVSGKILTSKGLPIIGATISESNTSQTTTSDIEGKFTIRVTDQKGVLSVRHLNYQTLKIDFDLNLKTTHQITLLENENSLNDVQVIGYGQTTKRLNTGSSSSISAKDIEKQPVTNILSTLSGRMAGVNVQTTNGLPGGGLSIQIRGKGSLLAGTEPLYIIDGIPFNTTIGTLNNAVNPLAIQSVNGSTSPFNSLNPDDIENITVLKDADATAIYGSRGSNGVVIITTKKGKAGKLRYSVSMSQAISKAAQLPQLLNLSQYLTMRREAFANDGKTPSSDPLSPDYAPDLLIWNQSEGTDWAKYLMGGTGNSTVFQGSVRGGNEQTNFLLSTKFRKESTILPGSNSYKRGGLQFSLNHTSSDDRFRLQFSNSLNVDDNRLSNAQSLFSAILLPPNYPVYDENGAYNWYLLNPVASLNAQSKAKTLNLATNLLLDYKIMEGLRFKTSTGFNQIRLNQTQIFPSSSMQKDNINYTNFGDNVNSSLIIEPQLNYNTNIGQLNLQGLIGGTYQQTNSKGEFIRAENFSSESLMENVGSAGTITAVNSYSDYRYLSFFGRLTANFRQKYILNATVRRDGSSKFGEGKQFGNFGSIGIAWLFGEERWLEEALGWLSFGKLRSSFGITGNDQISPYQYLSTYGSSPYSYQGIQGLRPTRIANGDFHWETTRKFEIAIELGFFRNRIMLNANAYLNQSDDQLVSYKTPYQTGFASYQANLPAIVENRGLELELNSKNITGSNFSWQTTFNLTLPRNRLKSFKNFMTSSYFQTLALNYDITRIYGYQLQQVNPADGKGSYLDINGNTGLTPYFYNTIGKQTPDLYGGLGNNLSLKNWTLDIFLQFSKQKSLGGIAYTPGIMTNNYIIVEDRWRKNGDMASIPKSSNTPDYYFPGSTANYFNSSYIRLKTINLSYDFKGTVLQKLKLERLSIFMQAQNILTFWNDRAPLADPETGGFTGASPNFPPLKTILFGIQTQF
ncbi:TonB-linked SusC/RagA family outer membrane protein [Flavobacterium sp. W4I14]|nr:TonB-linked SusC/RagA family outer membrane protein [Flavobacterium sp. W4I14]